MISTKTIPGVRISKATGEKIVYVAPNLRMRQRVLMVDLSVETGSEYIVKVKNGKEE